jgi:hypothetical protein
VTRSPDGHDATARRPLRSSARRFANISTCLTARELDAGARPFAFVAVPAPLRIARARLPAVPDGLEAPEPAQRLPQARRHADDGALRRVEILGRLRRLPKPSRSARRAGAPGGCSGGSRRERSPSGPPCGQVPAPYVPNYGDSPAFQLDTVSRTTCKSELLCQALSRSHPMSSPR